MRLTISRGPARAAALCAVAARVVLGLALEAPAAHNGIWLSALLGFILCLPWLAWVESCAGQGPVHPLLYAALLGSALLDGASLLSGAARAAGYLALESLPGFALELPLSVAALWCVHKNGDATGNAARLGAWIMAGLLALVVLLQAQRLRPEWLMPLLGEGWRDVFNGAVRTAGWMATVSGLFLLPDGAPPRPMRPVLAASLVASGVLVLHLMMTPTPRLGVTGWIYRLDSLVVNGRSPLYVQLPVIALLFAALLHLISCEAFVAAGLLQRLIPALDGHGCGIAAVGAIALLSALPRLGEFSPVLSQWRFPALALVASLATVQGGGKRAWAG